MQRSTSAAAFIYQTTDCQQGLAAQLLLFVGFRQRPLDSGIVGAGDRDSDGQGDLPFLDSPQQPLLALAHQLQNPADVGDRQSRLPGDVGGGVPSVTHGGDIPGVLDGGMLTARQVLDEADQQNVLLGGLDKERRDFRLTEALERLYPPLPASEHVAHFAVVVLACCDGDRFLQADLGDVRHDLLELLFAPAAGIGNDDLVERNRSRVVLQSFHAVTSIFLRWAMRVK